MERVLLNVREASELLAIGRDRLFRLAREGRIPCVRIGKSVRFPVAALRRWADENTSMAVQDAK